MTHPDPTSSPEYDPYEFFKDELGRSFEQELDQQTIEMIKEPEFPVQAEDHSYSDDDRLYTDEFMRQNEMASRFLLLSVLAAGLISSGIAIWFLMARNQAQPQVQPNAPLQVPAQPPLSSPLPSLNLNSPALPTAPLPSNTGAPANSGLAPQAPTSGTPATLPTSQPNSQQGVGATVPPPPPPPSISTPTQP